MIMLKYLPVIFCLIAIGCKSTNKQRIDNQSLETVEDSLYSPSISNIGSVEVLDDELNRFIAPGTQIEVLAQGFTWSEGPVWIEDEKYLIFSDVPENKVYKWKEGEGISIYLDPSGYTDTGIYSSEQGSNGLAINAKGQLLLCQHGDRRVAVMKNSTNNPSSEFISLAETYQGARFNSPNDLVIHPDGSIYFTDPPYGLPKRDKDTSSRELEYNGVYRISPEGDVSLLTSELTRPNGIAFNPGFTIAYVNISDRENLFTMAYDINRDDGSFENGRIFFDARILAADRKGSLDGLKVHPTGVIFATGPGGVLVLTPDGKHIGTILTTQATANCAFDTDYGYLYMTANNYLLRIRLRK